MILTLGVKRASRKEDVDPEPEVFWQMSVDWGL
jgi:hypothetical protein